MAVSDMLGAASPVVAGLAFACVGLGYRWGQSLRIAPMRICLFMGVGASAMFAARVGWPAEMPLRVLILGVAAGASQYLTVRLMGVTLSRGPFSPVWCALSLAFVPVAVYEALVQNVPMSGGKMSGVVLAAACVGVSSLGAPAMADGARVAVRPTYPLLLAAMLLLNALVGISLTDLKAQSGAAREGVLAGWNDAFFLLMYAAMGLGALVDELVAGDRMVAYRRALLPGAVASAGSIVGMLAMAAAVGRYGAIAVVVSGMITLLAPMLVSVTVFRERVTWRWMAVVLLGAAAVAASYW
jgi:hypothetical protein